MNRELQQVFFQGRHTNAQKVHDKVLNITRYPRNANQNHSEGSSHTCYNGYYLTKTKQKQEVCVGKNVEKRETCSVDRNVK